MRMLLRMPCPFSTLKIGGAQSAANHPSHYGDCSCCACTAGCSFGSTPRSGAAAYARRTSRGGRGQSGVVGAVL